MRTERPSWGDVARVRDSAPSEIPRGEASVCGTSVVEHPSVAEALGCPLGTPSVAIEYGDGTSIEVPDAYVEIVERADEQPA